MYHEGVMDGSHVLWLGGHVIDMFHGCRVVKNADLQGQNTHLHPQEKKIKRVKRNVGKRNGL